MLIVQISDIHSGPLFNLKSLRTAIEEINILSPDLVIITGDITEEGVRSQFRKAAKELNRLNIENIIYVSGNHDYRATGYLLFKHFFPFEQVTVMNKTAIIVLSSARPDRDDGEVGHRQNLWLEEELEKYKACMKVVAIHHHLIPVPDTGADQITIVDAGDVLRSLIKSDVDLVLCGHRHRPWKWKLGKMQVINAGSVSCDKLRGFFLNSYNVIKTKNRKVEAKLKIVGGDYVDFDKIVKYREIHHPSDLKK
jgi:putative phosphoesterase